MPCYNEISNLRAKSCARRRVADRFGFCNLNRSILRAASHALCPWIVGPLHVLRYHSVPWIFSV